MIGLQKLASVIPVLTSWVASPLTRCLVTAEKTNMHNCAYILVLLNTLLGIFGHSLLEKIPVSHHPLYTHTMQAL